MTRAIAGLNPVPRRIFEVVPPALAWVTLTSPAWASILAPKLLGFFLVAFSGYWLWRSCEFTIGLLLGIRRLHATQRRDWLALGNRVSGFENLHHLVLVPTYMESDEVLADTLHHLAAQTVARERIGVVLAFEERDPHASARAARLSQRFADCFGQWLVTMHPDLPGEVKGKSSNLAWAARRAEIELIARGHIDPHNLLVTVCDADSRLDPQYLAALGHQVLSHPDGRLHIYQPAILFYANHWRLIAPLRALNSIYSLWELARMVPSHRLVTQSTYSLSWTAVRDVNFWDVDVIPEDSHMCFKVLFHFGRRVKVRPIWLPVYADAAEGPSLRRTCLNQYHQILRWAWGISDIPYVVMGALRSRDLPWHLKIMRVTWYVEEHIMWPSHWFLLTLGGLVPALVNPTYAHSSLGVWQTSLISAIMGLCLPCLLLVIVADWRLRPEHPEGEDPIDVLIGWASFGLLPVFGLLLCALPALDAHTRLLFGRRLEYRVTEKVPVQARFRDQQGAPLPKPIRDPAPLRRTRFDQLPQYRAYSPGSTTAVTDSVLLVYRDLR